MRAKLVAALFAVFVYYSVANADYVLVLKNGRQITVQSYRTEGSMIKFNGMGGEIAISKEQVQTIIKAGDRDRPGVTMSEFEGPPQSSSTFPQKSAQPPTRDVTQVPTPTETESSSAEEVKEYQKRLAEVTQKLEAAKERYFKATQGGGTASNVTKEGFRSWVMDFASRIHDSQKAASGGGGPSSTPPTPPYAPNYTAKEKELSDLRAEIDNLQKERDSLIQEMKSKNIPTSNF